MFTSDLNSEFHVVGLEFTPAELRYYCDGQLVHVYDATAIEHQDVNI